MTQPAIPISPYLFGRNNSLSNFSFGSITQQDEIRVRDANVTILRENGGNNSTKYNWRRKLQSHPDWYNNVYSNDWGAQAALAQQKLPQAQVMFAFQLIGKAAKTNQNNFNDWQFNGSKWWEGVNQNLAGNGVMNNTGSKAKVDGNPDLYLEPWNEDSTTGILPHFFNDLKLDKSKLLYWNMDNEPEIWHGTHDDIISAAFTGEEFVQRYIAVAKKARKLYPDIKLLGPSPANEWQWYSWSNDPLNYKGKAYTWIEYFIKRIGEEQKASGMKLLDVLDLHFYPGANNASEIVQLHRVFFDKSYVFPEANGIKRINGGWDASQNKEYIYARINEWLETYIGTNHNISLGMTEVGINGENPNVTAVWYAGMLGEFLKNKVEIFTPWSWKVGMWETLHLFSRWYKPFYINTTSSDENNIIAYTTTNISRDSTTIFVINKSNVSKAVAISLDKIIQKNAGTLLELSALPGQETFFSHSQNALKSKNIEWTNERVVLNLPPYGIQALVIENKITTPLNVLIHQDIKVYPNPAHQFININTNTILIQKAELIDISGKLRKSFIPSLGSIQQFEVADINSGLYYLKLVTQDGNLIIRKIMIWN